MTWCNLPQKACVCSSRTSHTSSSWIWINNLASSSVCRASAASVWTIAALLRSAAEPEGEKDECSYHHIFPYAILLGCIQVIYTTLFSKEGNHKHELVKDDLWIHALRDVIHVTAFDSNSSNSTLMGKQRR